MERVGPYLISGREKAGMTLEQVSAITRIPLRSLRALEEDRFEDLPATAIARGFLIAYCRCVGLDPQPCLEVLAEYQRNKRQSPTRTGFGLGGMELLVGHRRQPLSNWSYLALVIVVAIGLLVAILTVGTGGGPEDVSKVIDVPKVEQVDPSPHG